MSEKRLIRIDMVARILAQEVKQMWNDIDELNLQKPGASIVIPNRNTAIELLILLDGGEPLKPS